MKSKSLILMVVSLGFGLIAAVGISQVMGRGTADQPALRTGPVVVPIEDLDHNSLLTEENCQIADWPLNLIPEGAARTLEDITDMATKGRMLKDMPILKTAIIHKNQRGKLPIPPGQKVMAIKVSAADVMDGLLQPGDKVDVVGVFRVRKQDRVSTTAKTFLKNVTVFAVAGRTQNDGTREAGNAKNNTIVSVLVTPPQAELLILVQKEASLTLTLRGEEDDDDESGIVEKDFLDSLFNENPEETEPQKGGSMADLLRGVLNPNQNRMRKMRVWEGSTPITYTFNETDPYPSSDRPAVTEPPETSESISKEETEGEWNNDGNGDYERSSENERDLEEDQYPGQ